LTKAQLLDLLKDRVFLCDGAMGTMLYAKGVYLNTCFDELNLRGPDLVKEIHREYIRSGADIIETNTFGANRFKLKEHGLEDRVHEINLAGIWPLSSLRNAEFMHNEVPGAAIPSEIMARMQRAQDSGPERARDEGVAIAREILAAIKGAVEGVQISPPLGRIELALDVLEVLEL
jgi:homocysteine S-methyltransferase